MSSYNKPLKELLAAVPAILETVGLPVGPPDPANQTAPVLSVDERILAAAKLTTGENNPLRPDAGTRGMANKTLRTDIDSIVLARTQRGVVLDGIQLQLNAFRDALAAFSPALALLTTELQATKAVQQAEQVKLTANTLADQALAAWLTQVEAEGKATKAEAALAKAEALAAKAATTAQALALTAAQTETATAKTKAEAAQAKADAAQAKADLAATVAATAQTAAATAQANAATAINNATTATALANGAQATATAAQTALDTFKARFRQGQAVTPAITIQVATPGVATVNFSPPYSDNKYRVVLGKSSTSLLALDLSVPEASKTVSSFAIHLRNTGLASLAVAAGTVDYIIMHD